MLDVAIVAQKMWHSVLSPRARKETAKALGLESSEDTTGPWVTLLAGLHDLGKASPAFQLQVQKARKEVEQQLRRMGLYYSPSATTTPPKHGTITAATLPAILETLFNLPSDVASRIGAAVGGITA